MFGSDLPYLIEVDDPWDATPGNPNHRWDPVALTGKQLASKLGVAANVVDVAAAPGAPGRPAVMRFTTTAGPVEQRISDLRWVLGLRSSSFRIGVLRLTRPAGPVAGGAKVTLTGVARDVAEPVLERRLPSGGWKRATRVKPRPDGTFAVPLRPSATTTFRLAAEGVPGPSVTVRVTGAPR
jgi:hypothetical protein